MLTPCIFKLEMSTMGICVAKPPRKVVFTTYSNRDVSRCSRHTAHSAPQLSVLSYLLKFHELCMQARCTGQTVSSFVYQLSDARVLVGAEALQGWMSQSLRHRQPDGGDWLKKTSMARRVPVIDGWAV